MIFQSSQSIHQVEVTSICFSPLEHSFYRSCCILERTFIIAKSRTADKILDFPSSLVKTITKQLDLLDLMNKMEELVGEGEETWSDGDRKALPGSILQKVQESRHLLPTRKTNRRPHDGWFCGEGNPNNDILTRQLQICLNTSSTKKFEWLCKDLVRSSDCLSKGVKEASHSQWQIPTCRTKLQAW